MGTTKLRVSSTILLLTIGVALTGPALPLGALLRRWAWSTWDRRNHWQGIIAFNVLNLCVFSFIWWKWHLVAILLCAGLSALSAHSWYALGTATGELWLVNLLLAPTFAVLAEGYTRLVGRNGAARSGTQLLPPTEVGGAFVLGEPLRGDLTTWVQKGWFTYPPHELARHLVLLGTPGSGKTETALRIAFGVARSYKQKVIYIDAKGDLPTAARFLTAMEQAGMKRIKMFPREPFCGWDASTSELHNRLMEVLDYSEPFYEDIANALVDFALNVPGGPPRNSSEFLGRLELYILRKLYAGTIEGAQLRRFSYEQIHGTFLRYRAFFGVIKTLLDGMWSFDDVDAAYLLLDGLGLKHQTASLGRFLIESFEQYMAHRQDSTGVLLIIDELSAIATKKTDVAGLFERVRGFGGHIVATAQSYAGMGPHAERILDASRGLIVHHCDDPGRLAARAGTRRVPEFSHQVDSDGVIGYSTLRMSEQFRVDPNEIRGLGTGECFVICGGRAQKVRVNALQSDKEAVQAILDEISQPLAAASQAPTPLEASSEGTDTGDGPRTTTWAGSLALLRSSPSTGNSQTKHPQAPSSPKPGRVQVRKKDTQLEKEKPRCGSVKDKGALKEGERDTPPGREPGTLPPADNDLFPELH